MNIPAAMNAKASQDRNTLTAQDNQEDQRIAKEKLVFERQKQRFEENKVDWRTETINGEKFEVPYLANGRRSPAPKRKVGKTDAQLKKEKGQGDIAGQLDTLITHYINLDEMGAMVNVENGTIANIGAALRSSPVGQKIEKYIGTDAQSIRNSIKAIKPALILAIKNAAELSGKGMDSERELEFYLQLTTNEDLDVQSNFAVMVVLDNLFGDGTAKQRMKDMGNPELLKRVSEIEEKGKKIREAELLEKAKKKEMSPEDEADAFLKSRKLTMGM